MAKHQNKGDEDMEQGNWREIIMRRLRNIRRKRKMARRRMERPKTTVPVQERE